MKRKIGLILCTIMLIGSLTACGGQQDMTTGMEGAVSNSAISASAVSISDVIEKEESVKKEADQYPVFLTDTNWYRDSPQDPVILQMRLDGTGQKRILKQEKMGTNLVSVVGGYLYYYTSLKDEPLAQELWRVPIGKDADGYDQILEKYAQKLATDISATPDANNFYVTEDILLYMTEDEKLVQMDLGTFEKNTVEKPVKKAEELFFYGYGKYIIAADSAWEGGVYVRDINTTKWRKITDYNLADWYYEKENQEWACNESYFFYYHNTRYGDLEQEIQEIQRCSIENGKEATCVDAESLKQVVSQALSVEERDIDVCTICDLFCVGERLYFQVQVNWEEENQYRMAYAILSQGQEEEKICWEADLNQCLWNQSPQRKGNWHWYGYQPDIDIRENVVMWEGECCDMVGENVYILFSLQQDDGYGRVGKYNRRERTFQWLSEDDVEYYRFLSKNYDRYYWENDSSCQIQVGSLMFKRGPKNSDGKVINHHNWQLVFDEKKENEE